MEEARRFREALDASTPVLVDLETVFDLTDNGRIDDPLRREHCQRLRDILTEALA
ncbi:hypothetical protein [Aminirod propionatiphilus]|uniref:Uncharacterized protein n=1 Tax=Aminirod propionatiphilus TaxID=3415223 RepID=A0ACD1DY03_9BACT|nr:hypothetical protein KIH16_04345 [Synergistota bacterium]